MADIFVSFPVRLSQQGVIDAGLSEKHLEFFAQNCIFLRFTPENYQNVRAEN